MNITLKHYIEQTEILQLKPVVKWSSPATVAGLKRWIMKP